MTVHGYRKAVIPLVQCFADICQITVCRKVLLESCIPLIRIYSDQLVALTIAFRSFAFILIAYVILLRLGSEYSITTGGRFSQWVLKTPGGWGFQASKDWTVMVPAALSAAASLPMLLEGLLHMPSLPVLVMLFVSHTVLLHAFSTDRS